MQAGRAHDALHIKTDAPYPHAAVHTQSLVPQDPVIFSGSVRTNLDPWGDAGGDDVIWAALRAARLDGLVRGLGVRGRSQDVGAVGAAAYAMICVYTCINAC